ncbi:MAG: hypothetical protein K2X29_14650 [Candidatus Obscuribacterales bacterium]|nr:hypothetical protein [Candidatus Obscuribacterales bacterium]
MPENVLSVIYLSWCVTAIDAIARTPFRFVANSMYVGAWGLGRLVFDGINEISQIADIGSFRFVCEFDGWIVIPFALHESCVHRRMFQSI